MTQYNILASMEDATVVAEYTPEKSTSKKYQSEAELEKELIQLLQRQGYEYLVFSSEAELIKNLRKQLESLNNYSFTDSEWERFFKQTLSNSNDGIVEKTRMIQQDNVQVLKRDDGTSKNITIIDKKNVHNNILQVINQYVNNDGFRDNRYDVTILVNGLPMVHIELKRRGVHLKEAFNQIERYQRESFWAGSGLYEYIQIFVISNGTHTKYYSNTTRASRIKEATTAKGSTKKTSNSFEFTSFWADSRNRTIPDLVDFAKTFLAKHTVLNVLTKYCVLTSEDLLLVMRPYQITATERILNRIELANNYHYEGTIKSGGYIWHTTGSGKTLTSFKTAQMASNLSYIDKVLFVVDRQDLDYQTMKEYDRFEKGCADGNKSTKVLENQLSNLDAKGKPKETKIIITTIQKLSIFVGRNKDHEIRNKKVVIIFDECHRSQFGAMHSAIVKYFKKYFLFGFTGTPIFAENSQKKGDPRFATTPQLFGESLHRYTIVDAINDQNVLPFRIDYVNTMKQKEDKPDQQVEAIASEKALRDPDRIAGIVSYMLDHFDQKTKRSASYVLKGRNVSGFNCILATGSRFAAMDYYTEFKKQIAEKGKDYKIATIFTFNPNEEAIDNVNGLISEEDLDTTQMDATSRDFLDRAIDDYNKMFSTSFSTDGDKFGNYYKDLSMRMKNREIDLLIVVDMFLTGFDATTLNTLWVDKNLRMHGLIQAFSRTNRILNSVKTYGNIVCFRNLEKRVDEAISLFGDKDANSIILLKSYEDYYDGYQEESGVHHPGYRDIVDALTFRYPLDKPIIGEKAEKDFIGLFSSLLVVMNILSSFDRFANEHLLSDRDMQNYQSIYIDLYHKWRKPKAHGEDIHDDVEFELELVKQIEVNIDYILELVRKYHEDHVTDQEAINRILKVVDSSIELRSKKELIKQFLEMVNVTNDIGSDWKTFVEQQKEKDIIKIVEEENLKEDLFRKYLADCFESGALKLNGTEIDSFMAPVSRFGGGRAKKKAELIEKLEVLFDKYYGV
ncbi:MAG: type I restriction endonuclease subunit R [Erysipelotrichaceae bacterium]|nr:type I restriction endonuclease subunit R [Erysipelotrichaceae bacterium]